MFSIIFVFNEYIALTFASHDSLIPIASSIAPCGSLGVFLSQQQSWYLAHLAIALKLDSGDCDCNCIDSGFQKREILFGQIQNRDDLPAKSTCFYLLPGCPARPKDLLLLPAKHSNRTTHKIVTQSDDFEAKKAMRAFETSGWQEKREG